jgi:hypothetical protein
MIAGVINKQKMAGACEQWSAKLSMQYPDENHLKNKSLVASALQCARILQTMAVSWVERSTFRS